MKILVVEDETDIRNLITLHLKKAGYEVIGVFIRVWEPAGFVCNWREERREARRVAAHLDIPLLTLDLSREYKKRVVDYFIAEYKEGRTPNPDVMCNKHIKFGIFYDCLESGNIKLRRNFMKKYLSIIVISICMISNVWAKKKDVLPSELKEEVKKVILFTDLTSEMTKELLEGKHSDVAIECREGVELPFKYVGDFGLYSINFAPNLSVKMERTCYLRFVKKNRLNSSSSVKSFISFDLKNWEKASSYKSKGPLEVRIGMSPDKSHVVIDTFSAAQSDQDQNQ